MPALIAGIHVFAAVEDVDGRDKPGHDAGGFPWRLGAEQVSSRLPLMLKTQPMTQRIEARFQKCRAEGRAALVTYIMAGDPDPETSLAILKSLPKAGADIVEFGMPFTDPMADGPAIQAAGLRALKAGQNTPKTLELVRRFREADRDTPLILMGYFNPI